MTSEIRALFDGQSAAIRAKDVDRLMSFYADDIVYFDVVPPLRYVGAAALRGRFETWFGGYEGVIDVDTSDLAVLAGEDLAVTHWFNRIRGGLRTGREVGSWVRATSSWHRRGDRWLITHEHVSLPVDMATGSAVADLKPCRTGATCACGSRRPPAVRP
jgi:ketosteroid isomerase-like protein